MRVFLHLVAVLLAAVFCSSAVAQSPLSLHLEVEGKVGYTAAAGSFRTQSDAVDACAVGSSSSVDLTGIPAGATVEAAVLHWIGSGATIDGSVTLDGVTITDASPLAESVLAGGVNPVSFFQGSADVTAAVAAKGNGTYVLGGLTVQSSDNLIAVPQQLYCTLGLVVKGWALHVIYNDPSLTRRSRIRLYDGVEIRATGGVAASIDAFETPSGHLSSLGYVVFDGDPGEGTGESVTISLSGGATVTLDDTDPFNAAPLSLAGTEGAATFGVDLDLYDLSSDIPSGTTSASLSVNAAVDDLVILSSAALQMESLASDLGVSLTASDATPAVQGETTVTVGLDNAGPDASGAASVAVVVPAGYTLVSSAAPAGTSFDSGTGTWSLPSGLAVSESEQLELTLRAETDAAVTLTATASADARVEEDDTDNDGTLGLDAGPEADLALSITTPTLGPVIGANVLFTVSVTNDGPTDATGVTADVTLAGSLVVVSITPSLGLVDPGSGVWDIGDLAAGETVTAAVLVTIGSGPSGTVSAEVLTSDQPDPDSTPGNGIPSEDDQGGVTVTPGAIDLALSVVADDPAPAVGDQVTMTVTVTNESGNAASDVQVSAPFVARAGAVTIVSATPGVGTYDGTLWLVGPLAAGASASLDVVVQLEEDQVAYTVAAEVALVAESDADSTPYNGATSEDDYATATVTTGGSSSGGEGGLESNGSMAQALAQVLYDRRTQAARRADAGRPMPLPVVFAQARALSGSALASVIPTSGPASSVAVAVSPTDLLPVTNAREVVAADYVRGDGRRVGAVFATATLSGEVYEHTKPVCDRLRGGSLDGIETVTIASRPFVLARLVQADGSIDYAISFVVYGPAHARTVDSRFLLHEYDLGAMGGGDVLNFQVWGPSREYAAALVTELLAGLAEEGPLQFRNEGARAPTVPGVFVQSGRYENGRLILDVYNAAGATSLRLTGGTLARTEGGGRLGLDRTVPLPAGTPDTPVVTVEIETGPIFDAGFFVETDASTAPDHLYLADGTWGVALDPDSGHGRLDGLEVSAEMGAPVGGTRRIERPVRVSGQTDSWATLYRTLRPSGQPVDLSAYRYVEFEAAGTGDVHLLLQQASIATSDHFGVTLRLTPEARRHRIWFDDLRLADGTRGFDGADVVALSFTTRAGGEPTPFEIVVRDLRVGGAEGDPGMALAESALLAAAPNPFTRQTRLRFDMAEAGPARLSVYDMLGREVARLADGDRPVGRHTVDLAGNGLARGVYVVRLDLQGRSFTQRITLVR